MGKNILLVDDDALLRRSLAFNLEQNGFMDKQILQKSTQTKETQDCMSR